MVCMAAVAAIAWTLAMPGTGRAQNTGATQVVDLTYSTSQLQRNAAASLAVAETVVRVTDMGAARLFGSRFTAPGVSGALLRITKLALFDAQITNYLAGLNHELGHVAGARENGVGTHVLFVGGPWSSPQFDLSPYEFVDSSRFTSALGIIGGGFEAEFVLERRLWERLHQQNQGSPADAVVLLTGAAKRVWYMHTSLSALTGIRRFDIAAHAGDAKAYVYQMLTEGWSVPIQDPFFSRNPILMAQPLKRGLWLNLADFGLWDQAWNLVNYVVTGQSTLKPHWLRVRGVSFIPFASYLLSPVGPQTEVGTHYRTGGMVGEVSVRWTQDRGIPHGRLLGLGLSWSRSSPGLVAPRLRFDVWQDADRQAGTRVEGGLEFRRWPSPGASLHASAGAKTSGFVLGLPERSGVYAETGFRVRF